MDLKIRIQPFYHFRHHDRDPSIWLMAAVIRWVITNLGLNSVMDTFILPEIIMILHQ
jgi:hypothetical protein